MTNKNEWETVAEKAIWTVGIPGDSDHTITAQLCRRGSR